MYVEGFLQWLDDANGGNNGVHAVAGPVIQQEHPLAHRTENGLFERRLHLEIDNFNEKNL